ncbi:glucans biosynthesis glucosyltransferase MdoH [Marinomonas epiphytica]
MTLPHLNKAYALPKTAPLAMPRHEVNEPRQASNASSIKVSTLLARIWIVMMSVGLTYYGAREMYLVLSTNSISSLQWLFWLLFCLNFSWIAFAFSQATLGMLYQLWPFKAKYKEQEADGVTAILLPVYNEDPTRIRASIEAMHSDLVAKAAGKFAFFILSDTNQADAWLAEEETFYPLVNHDKQACPIYYRRRHNNQERKAGNIADWVTRFGGDYDCMIVLDADSLMSAESLLTLSRRMAATPSLGLIQTLPTLIRANTLYGRIQQFANHCFGPIYAAGLAAWHGEASNFWGHNAIIRTQAFAQACGLPILKGKAPFGGHVMSHDFMEAALLRRAGWGVRFDLDIQTSYEEAPPSLIDVIVRDRRWCQGNLQHKAFVTAQGFHFASRIHLLSGIMSYLSAVFWFMLILVGFTLAIQAYFVRPEYFANPSLFPTWPVFDFERARALFALSMFLVLAPKLYGWLNALLKIRLCKAFGGPILLTLSTLAEVVLSALYAPIMMLSQFQVVCDILRGQDSGWRPQSRDDGANSWLTVWQAHRNHTLLGIALALGTLTLSTELFYWSLPITFGLMLSMPLSWLSGGSKRGNLIAKLGLLRAPEEKHSSTIVSLLNRFSDSAPPPKTLPAIERLTQNKTLYGWHLAQLNPASSLARNNQPNRSWVYSDWQIRHNDKVIELQTQLLEQDALTILEHHTLVSALGKYLEKDTSAQTA